MKLKSLLRRALATFASLALLGILAIAALFAFAWFEHRSDVDLPTPTGPFSVGRSIRDWVHTTEVDSLAPVAGTRRELLVWIWYPSAAAPTAVADDYLPAQLRPKGDASGGANIWTLLTRDVTKVHGHSTRDPDVSPRQPSYPVVIMRAGASAPVMNYSTLAEDLASHGYIVVGFDAPYRTGRVVFPDGRVADITEQNNPEACVVPERVRMEQCVRRVYTAWTRDIAFVLDRLTRLNASDSSGRFTGRIDVTRVGVFGHSLGGAVAAQFCHDDSRCKAAIDIDGAPHGTVLTDSMTKPLMFLLSDHSHESDSTSVQIKQDIQSIYDRVPADGRQRVAIRGAFHFMFSDDGAVRKSGIVHRILRVLGRLGIDPRRQLAVTAYCVHTFFDHYLEGAGGSSYTISSSLYPEIQVLQ